ncbi:hypothetical protein [Ornithinibacillus contaminans]|uniref:hypothetical protein n=1 Tax=Ornithinibacillus contaminans TaxID=694055 RepID=UPI0012ECBAD8|nr:hypothetical protein [Ornithinibacillus contaminans]
MLDQIQSKVNETIQTVQNRFNERADSLRTKIQESQAKNEATNELLKNIVNRIRNS